MTVMTLKFLGGAMLAAVLSIAGAATSAVYAEPAGGALIRVNDPDPYSPGGGYRPRREDVDRYDNRDNGYLEPPRRDDAYRAPPPRYVSPEYGKPYAEPKRYSRNAEPYDPDYGPRDRSYRRDDGYAEPVDHTYSENEIVNAGHRFFGSVSQGLAKAIQYVFKRSGRPNGYILGEDAGGAFVAGLRYGEGRLYTKNFRTRRVYWQGPSLGYDFGGEGSKVMTLVYNLRRPSDIYKRYGGVQGSAYLVGGVSVQLQKRGEIILAPIRSGVGLRLGANVGYLKYSRRPTWNPF